MFRFLSICILMVFASFSTPISSENRFSYVERTGQFEGKYLEMLSLYTSFGLDSLLPLEAFEQAFTGYEKMEHPKKNILSIIDFTKPSTEERMFVLDMENQKVLFQTVVAHGKNSGEQFARKFSNKHGSFQSSLGFFRTANTYYGGNGYSLVIEGLEKGINDQAKARAVVIHGADYCSEDFIRKNGRLGRSYGCPSLPHEVNRAIIDTIKEGSLLFIYAKDQEYQMLSALLRPDTKV